MGKGVESGSERSKIGNAYPKSEIEDQQPQHLGRNVGSVKPMTEHFSG